MKILLLADGPWIVHSIVVALIHGPAWYVLIGTVFPEAREQSEDGLWSARVGFAMFTWHILYRLWADHVQAL